MTRTQICGSPPRCTSAVQSMRIASFVPVGTTKRLFKRGHYSIDRWGQVTVVNNDASNSVQVAVLATVERYS